MSRGSGWKWIGDLLSFCPRTPTWVLGRFGCAQIDVTGEGDPVLSSPCLCHARFLAFPSRIGSLNSQTPSLSGDTKAWPFWVGLVLDLIPPSVIVALEYPQLAFDFVLLSCGVYFLLLSLWLRLASALYRFLNSRASAWSWNDVPVTCVVVLVSREQFFTIASSHYHCLRLYNHLVITVAKDYLNHDWRLLSVLVTHVVFLEEVSLLKRVDCCQIASI